MLLREFNFLLAVVATVAVFFYIMSWEISSIRGVTYSVAVISTFIYFYFSKKQTSTFVFSLPVIFVFLALFSQNFDFSDIPFISGLVNIQIQQKTLLVYFLGVTCLYLGWILGNKLAKETRLKRVGFKAGRSKLLLWSLYYFFLIINLFAMYKVGGLPIFDIALRWGLDPKLIFIGGLQIYLVPFILYRYRNSKNYSRYLLFIILMSSITLALLGARNPLFKLVVLITIFNVVMGKWSVNAILKYGLTFGLVAYLLIGIYTKSGIYDVDISAKMIMAILSMDSLGTLYNFDRIIQLTPDTGYFHGQLIGESILKMVPGVSDARYANQHIGIYLGYGDSKSINGTVVHAQISLSPTMFGVAYADFGLLGVIVSTLILSTSLGYLYKGIEQSPLFCCYFSILAMIIMYSTYGGYYGADLLYGILMSLLFIIINLLVVNKHEEESC